MKLSKAQVRYLARMPDDDWYLTPNSGDTRPLGPLLRNGALEERRTDVTPVDWGSGPVRVVRSEIRVTPAGRAALKDTTHAE